MKNFALAGNPNCGKTTLFNSLTGSTAHVGNWAGVTVDKTEGVYKKNAHEANIIDLPGIYSLSPYTSEEVIARKYILDEKPDCVINIVDATSLERNLYLTTQLLEIDVPVVVALNMMDVVRKAGDTIKVKELSEKLGVPVVEISALKQDNLDELITIAIQESEKERKGTCIIQDKGLAHLISDISIAFKTMEIPNPLFHAVKLVELDPLETKDHKDLVDMVNDYKESHEDVVFGNDFEALIADARYNYIGENFMPFMVKKDNHEKLSKSEKIDKVLTNKYFGLPIFVFLLFLVFHLTFSSNFLFLGKAIKTSSFAGSEFFEGALWAADQGIAAPGTALANLLTGVTDLLTDKVRNAMSGMQPWATGLVCDGILSGVFAVISFLPQILVLFLLFSIFEDSGYMARVTFLLDKLLRKFGLSGRAFIPMIMGFGCSVPAMINTRTLSNEDEKVATIRVIPFFSCSAKLPALAAVAGYIAERVPNLRGVADLVTLGMYLLGMITAIVCVILMRKTIMRGKNPPFIMELPTYHWPQFKSLMIHIWNKAKHFLKKAFTIILASTIVIWLFTHLDWSWHFIDDAEIGDSILGSLGKFIQPLFTPLGFGFQNQAGWAFIVALITGVIAKENAISTLEVLDLAIVSSLGVSMFETCSIPSLLAFIAFNMTTIPCVGAVATARAEMRHVKFKNTLIFWLVTSFIVSSGIYLIGTYWWTAFIYVGAFVAAIFIINAVNKKKDLKVKQA